MSEAVFPISKQLRLTFAAAMIVAIVLVYFGHAPVFPVIAGAILAVGAAVLQAWFRSRK